MTSGAPLHLGSATFTQRGRSNIPSVVSSAPRTSEIPSGFHHPAKGDAQSDAVPKIPWQRPVPLPCPPLPPPPQWVSVPDGGGGGDAHAEVSLLLSAMGDFVFVWLQIPRDRAVWGGEEVTAGCRLLPPVGS